MLGDIGYPAKPTYQELLLAMADRFQKVFVIAGNHGAPLHHNNSHPFHYYPTTIPLLFHYYSTTIPLLFHYYSTTITTIHYHSLPLPHHSYKIQNTTRQNIIQQNKKSGKYVH
jgi:hypothetical protein